MQRAITVFDSSMDWLKSVLTTVIEPLRLVLNFFSEFWTGAVLIAVVFALLFTINMLRGGSDFLKIMKKPYTLVICAMMIAVNVALGYFTINISSYLRIGFGFVTLPIVGTLFGPAAGCFTGILQDVVSFMLKPTGAYIFTYTLNVGISGMIHGMMLYKKPVSFARVFMTKLIIVVIVNIILNSVALAPTVGSGMAGILPARIIKNIILLPIHAVISYALLKAAEVKIMRRIVTD